MSRFGGRPSEKAGYRDVLANDEAIMKIALDMMSMEEIKTLQEIMNGQSLSHGNMKAQALKIQSILQQQGEGMPQAWKSKLESALEVLAKALQEVHIV